SCRQLSRGCHKNIIQCAQAARGHPPTSEPDMTFPKLRIASLALASALFAAACQPSGDATGSADSAAGDRVATQVSGAGASFIYPLLSRWSADYNAATGQQVNYQSIGSGGGIAQVKA